MRLIERARTCLEATEGRCGPLSRRSRYARSTAPCGSLKRNAMKRYEYKIIDTGKHVEDGSTAREAGLARRRRHDEEQLLIAPPQAIVLMREVEPSRLAVTA